MTDIRQKLLGVFQAEAGEHLARMRAILGEHGAATGGAQLEEVFRRAHSLKGASRAVDLKTVENLAHPLETLFVRVRDGSLRLDPPVMKVVHSVLDAIEDGVASLLAAKTPREPVQELEAIAGLLGAAGAQSRATLAPVIMPAPAQHSAPAAQRAQPVESFSETSVRISTSVVDRLHRSAGQLATESQRQDVVTQNIVGVSRDIAALVHEADAMRTASAAALRRLNDTPELSRIARFVEIIEHGVRSLSKDARSLRLMQQRSAWALQNLGSQLQQDVLGARMISAESVFDSFGKMMRDLARDEDKELNFKAAGLSLEADRLVLQALKDPLMHLLRNTIAHGIESPAERKSAGKDPAGTVSLQLETQGNLLRITVEDDGRGVDLNRVSEIAVKKGLLSQTDAAALSPAERMRLIFRSGFSTVRTVTELAGRGMGLNVVTDAASRLQGNVDVEARPGGGTRFIVTVPLAISTHRLLLVKCSKQTFAIPCQAIERLSRVRARELISIEGRPAVSLNGKPMPLVSLAHLLKCGEPIDFSAAGVTPIVVLKAGEKRLAVAVDLLQAEIQGVIKDLNPIVMKAGKLAGGILLGDGSVVLVLNGAELIESFQHLDKTPLLKAAAPAKQVPTILVVDDSITTRSLEKSILETHGYRVLVAVDGVEALSTLRSAKVDLVVCDIEMPRMNGFALLEEAKKDAQLATIPFVMVTSLEKREDKERGLALGAAGYIVKRKFDQKDLLEAIRQML